MGPIRQIQSTSRLIGDLGRHRRLLQALACAGLGGFLFNLLAMPAAWISGGMIGAALFAMRHGQPEIPVLLRNLCFIALGFTMGSEVTPETLGLLALWPLSLLLLAISVGGTILVLRLYLRRVFGWDRMTATLSAIPGTFSYIILMSIRYEADTSRVAVMQVSRMIVLAAVLPSVITAIEPAAAIVASDTGAADAAMIETVLAVVACGLVGYLFERGGLAGGTLVGSMIASLLIHGAGWTKATLPGSMLVPCFVFIGAFIGVRLGGLSGREILRTLGPSLSAILIGLAIAAAAAVLAASWLDLPLALVLLAYAPGGLDVMAALALLLNLDPAFVAGHGILRFVSLSLLLPLWLRRRAAILEDQGSNSAGNSSPRP